MSDAQPEPKPAVASLLSEASPSARREQHALAQAQQGLLERDLRIADLAREVEELRAANVELELGLQATAPWRPRHLASYAKQQVKRTIRPAEPTAPYPGIALAGLPVAPGSALPQWTVQEWIAGQAHPAVRVDPPTRLAWDLDLVHGTEVTGFVALRPAAWDKNGGGFDLFVELHDPAGGLVGSFVTAVDPAGLEDHRRWLPWRVALPATGPHRLTLRTEVASGAGADFCWGVIGDPRLETPALRARSRSADGERSSGLLDSLGSVRERLPRRAGDGPSISLLMPVHDPEPGLLDRTIAAVFGQTDARWQLCIVDDGSSDPAVRDRLARAASDGRVSLARHEQAQGISGATNAAFAMATGAFVATLDHDDLLAPDAIERIRAYLAAHPETDLVYSDNDILAGDRRFSASLKPDWSPELLRSVMYTLHFSAYRRAAIEAIGGWRSAFDGAQDHDLVLRLSESTDRIGHLPRVLYHWRAHAGSAALGELAKPLAYERGVQAIQEHLQRTGHGDATVTRMPGGRYRVRYPRAAPVTVVAGVEGVADGASAASALQEAVASILSSLRPDDRLVLAATEAGAAVAEALVAAADDDRVATFRVEAPADASLPGDTLAAVVAASESVPDHHVVVLMEAVAAPHDADAIDALAGLVEAGATAAGGVVGTADGRLLAGGISFPSGLPLPAHPDASLDDDARHPILTLDSNRLAVRGVVAIQARDLAEHRAAAMPLTRLALAGITLAAHEAGGRIAWSPHARFTAPASAAAALLAWPIADALALDRGPDRPDPYWNPLRWPDRGDETIPEWVHGTGPLDRPDR
jgi:hypothetical protein